MRRVIFQLIVAIAIIECSHLIINIGIMGRDAFLPITSFNNKPFYYDLDSLYGVTKNPNERQLMHFPWGSKLYESNNLGFRDDKFKNEGYLFIGNSFVEGYGVSSEDRFTEILESNIKMNVNNAGAAGVWSPIQSLVLLQNIEQLGFNKVEPIIILTPNEVAQIGERNPISDPDRNYPYKNGDSIVFYKSAQTSFVNQITLKSKIKRLIKYSFIYKVKEYFKYYGSSKSRPRMINFNPKSFNWFLQKIENSQSYNSVNIIILNNLNNVKLADINNFKYSSDRLKLNIIDFPNNVNLYFSSNSHLNSDGNEVLANLILNTIQE